MKFQSLGVSSNFQASKGAAVYVHVDDGLFLSRQAAKGATPICDELMQECAQHLEKFGFATPDIRTHKEIDKVIGYKIEQDTATLTLSNNKIALLSLIFSFLIVGEYVDTGILHSV